MLTARRPMRGALNTAVAPLPLPLGRGDLNCDATLLELRRASAAPAGGIVSSLGLLIGAGTRRDTGWPVLALESRFKPGDELGRRSMWSSVGLGAEQLHKLLLGASTDTLRSMFS